MVAGDDPTARLVDRGQDLGSAVTTPVALSRVDILRMAIESEQRALDTEKLAQKRDPNRAAGRRVRREVREALDAAKPAGLHVRDAAIGHVLADLAPDRHADPAAAVPAPEFRRSARIQAVAPCSVAGQRHIGGDRLGQRRHCGSAGHSAARNPRLEFHRVQRDRLSPQAALDCPR